MNRRSCGIIAGMLTLAACSGSPEAPAAKPSALIETRAAASRPFEEILNAYGTVEFAPSAMISLPVQFEARVAKLWVVSGAAVHKGEPIVDLSASAAAQLDFDKAQRDAAAAAAEAERQVRLRSQGLATEADLQNARNAALTARELRASLIARIGVRGAHTLTAPQDGIVDALTAQPGDLLAPGTVVARIAQPDSLVVRLGIEPRALARVLPGNLVRLSPLSAPAQSVSARINSVDRRVDPQTHLAQAISNLPRDPGLLPGAPVSARIVLAEHEHAISVPSSAVLYDRDQTYVFVVSDKVAHRRAVHLGVRDGEALEIRDGLNAGELVAISGNYELQDGMAIRLAQESPR